MSAINTTITNAGKRLIARKRLRAEYQNRIAQYDTLLGPVKKQITATRHDDTPEQERDLLRAERRRLDDLKQLCTQIIVDIESLGDIDETE